MLALCDHDTVMGIDEAKLEADKLCIELIYGVEISTNWEGRGIHIVGLNFDKTHPKMTALLSQVKKALSIFNVFCLSKRKRTNILLLLKWQ